MPPEYPFTPKSTTHLRSGQFWSFPLKNKRFAAGCVVSRLTRNGKLDTRLFLAGLLDWCGGDYPTPDDLANARILDTGAAHIKTITENGGHILGIAAIRGIFATPTPKTDYINTWGYGVIHVLAEKYFGAVS
jgi:hypothetical protein